MTPASRYSLLTFLVLMFVPLDALWASESQETRGTPNVLFIAVDDLRTSIAHRIRTSLPARESVRAGDATAKCAAPRSGASLSCGWIARRFPHAAAGPPIS